MPSMTPLSLGANGIELSEILAEQNVGIFSLSLPARERSADLTRLIDWKLWVMCALIVSITIGILSFLGAKKGDTNPWRTLINIPWSSLKLMFSQDSTIERTWIPKFIGASLAIVMVLIFSLSSALMSTDLVIDEKPFTIDTLEDVLDPRASNYRPIWRKAGGLHTIFSQSSSPIKQKIWQKALRIGLDKCLMDDRIWHAVEFGSRYSETPALGFLWNAISTLLKTLTCSGVQLSAQGKPHIGKEIVSSELFTFICNFRNNTCQNTKRTLFKNRVQKIFEANAMNYRVIQSVITSSLSNPFEQWHCLGLRDPFESKQWLPISTFNMRLTFLYFFAGLLISTIVLIGEVMVARYIGKPFKHRLE
ncbi:uncharacterized protein LOC141850706 [Brevipalpus obovatus]|uniref:uncharacterized protein LOC141850706 n=1 Tax=Brevipalpus obovatus TaxID=246614 RepID=UPI003D9EDAA7